MLTAVEKIDYGLIPVIDVARELLGQETRRTNGVERHFDGHGGLFVNLKKNRWYSHGNATGGDAIALIRFAHGCDCKAAFDWLRSHGYESFLGERADTQAGHQGVRLQGRARREPLPDSPLRAEGLSPAPLRRQRRLDLERPREGGPLQAARTDSERQRSGPDRWRREGC
jgi:hypothetical protein